MAKREVSSTSTSRSPPSRLTLPKPQTPDISAAGSPLHSPRHETRQQPGIHSPSPSHRSSMAEGVRGHTHRSSSFSHHAVQELMNNPPVGPQNPDDERFVGRDWRTIRVEEIIHPDEVRFAEVNTSVEEATKVWQFLRRASPSWKDLTCRSYSSSRAPRTLF